MGGSDQEAGASEQKEGVLFPEGECDLGHNDDDGDNEHSDVSLQLTLPSSNIFFFFGGGRREAQEG